MEALLAARLRAQLLTGSKPASPRVTVERLLAIQAQDYRGGLWAIGQRTEGVSEADVEAAIADRHLVRTWPMRHTLHLVAAADARWLTALLGPRALQKAKGRHRGLGLDAATFAASRKVFEKLLAKEGAMTRPEAYAALARAKISPDGQRGIHILGTLAIQGVLCLGPHRGKQPAFVLVDAWLPKGRELAGDEALGEVATRYFTTRGPATANDFAWWTGWPLGEARRAIAIAAGSVVEERSGDATRYAGKSARVAPALSGVARLLPPFDEYLVAYKDRAAMLEPRHAPRLGNLLAPVVELDGRVIGTWRRDAGADGIVVRVSPFARLAAATRTAIAEAATTYGAFRNRRVELRFEPGPKA